MHDWICGRSRVLIGLVMLATLSACGGGGGDSSGSTSGTGAGTGGGGQPTIVATVIAFPSGSVPPGFVVGGHNSIAAVKITDQSGASITNAAVTVDGLALGYVASDQQYEVAFDVSPGATVTVSATVNAVAYTASRTNFSTYPTITAPAAAATWSAQAANLISWSGVVPDTTAQYALGVFDSNGALVWPTNGALMTVPGSQNTATVNPGSLGTGNDLILVGMIDATTFPGAGAGSGLGIGGFVYVPVSVVAITASLQSVAVAPAPTVTVAIGKSTQLTATAAYSDGTSVDVTAQATWSSADTTKVTVSSSGVVSGVAAGSASVTAQFGGFSGSTSVNVFQPNPSPTPPLSQSMTFQIDYAHSGRATVGANGPTFPPTAHWSNATLSGTLVSYPVIAGGKVFVTTNIPVPPVTAGGTVYALDETTGNVVWMAPLAGTDGAFTGAAYDHGTLFVINYDGVLRSFDAATGAAGYSVQLSQSGVTSPPAAVNGVVYVVGEGGTTAADETNGNTVWTSNSGADHSSPAASSDGVFVSGPCDVWKFDPIVGTTLWHFAEGCFGGGGKTAVFANSAVYARELLHLNPTQDESLVLDGATGKKLGTFSAGPPPAFNDTTGFFQADGTLTATSLSSGNTLWTFTGDGGLVSAPIVIDNVVVVGSSSGAVYALDSSNGSVLWSGSAGAAIAAPDEQNAILTTGLGAGDGYLVVPAGTVLNGWRVIP